MTPRVLRRAVVAASLLLVLACSDSGPSEPTAAAGAAAPATEPAPPPAPRPRLILLISIDTLRADHLGFYGHERFTSPVLDTLAREGVVFDDVTASASWTLPSHATLLTGLFPREHGAASFTAALPAGTPTVASLLNAAGWTTGAVVNVEWLKRENYGVTRDFERYAWAPSMLERRSSNTWVTDQLIDWIDERRAAPLFLFAHYYDVHSDYKAEPAYERLFLSPYDGPIDGTGVQLKVQALPDAYIESCRHDDTPRCSFGDYLVVDESTHKLALGDADIENLEERYDAQIRQLDTELARVFTHLRKVGLFDDTLLIVTSDHGEEFMEHGSLEHFYTAYQEAVRVPLLLRGPGVPAGRRISAPVGLVDLAPTILARAGVDVPSAMPGLDLARLWGPAAEESDARSRSRSLWIEAPGGAALNETTGDYFPVYRALRQGRYKLVFEGLSGRHALYDLTDDPGETHDLSAEQPERAAEMLARLQARIAETPGPGNDVQLAPEDLERLRALGYVP